MSARLHACVDGPSGAPALVLGSSLGTSGAMWLPQLPALTRRYRVIRYDHLGHGDSDVPAGPYTIAELGRAVLGLLDDLDLPRVSYAGLSLGGMVGMWLAANAPERIDRLVLLCTSAWLGPAAGWRDRAAATRTGGMETVADAVLGRWFTPDFAVRRPELVAAYRSMLTATPPEGYAGCCEAIAAMDLRDDLARIAAPTLVLAGADDPAVPVEHARLLADRIPGAGLGIIDGAAHLASVEQPDRVGRLILAHLAAAAPDPAGADSVTAAAAGPGDGAADAGRGRRGGREERGGRKERGGREERVDG
ncbi:3-oxoadipate enol-lactonase [Micromonospora sp. WMMD1102]|uniref:3-oxoadipate enol-lactonase n=1 Tax=Micromonospora sp. WMMD1102 TaxID=3016105 RepID=UPI00241533BC|nr:3-oxoadipate enol-lactonase [Micromonospora sp. WMMD1102]MDG4786890.1 3-oxoadipate enol-lactonase [Micromonospora sp. WMMD1102]